MLFTGLTQGLDALRLRPWGMAAMYLIFPIQTVVCAGVLAFFWRDYGLERPRAAWVAGVIGVLAAALWVSPQEVFHYAPRLDGFNPGMFAGGIYWAVLAMRLVRLVAVVPALEEVFWRGFLLRYLIDEDFDTVPFGKYARMANIIVAVGFMLEHSPVDWLAALATGVLYNLVAFRTRSLGSCILAHAITNALLGAFILATRQWGFW